MGLLTITNATLNLDTIWPRGESDGDTFTLNVGNATFEFRPRTGTTSTITKLYESASTRSRYGQKVCINAKNQLRLRLQGVDSPELHYRPLLSANQGEAEFTREQRNAFNNYNFRFRQVLAEEASFKLREVLLKYGVGEVRVRVESRIDLPGEVFDCYSRFIGDAFVTEGGTEFWINRWLLEEGLAFAAYYDSMEPDEIDELNRAWQIGKQKDGGVWMGFKAKIPAINSNMLYSSHKPGTTQDKALTLPKVFRRQTEWWARDQANLGPAHFMDFLRSKKDRVRTAFQFIQLGRAAESHKSSDFISEDETLRIEPENVIYAEEAATLIHRGVPPAVISSWSLTKEPMWSAELSGKAWVNSVAISDDGRRTVGATFLHNYEGSAMVLGAYALSVFDAQGGLLWAMKYPRILDGIFSVAISGNGQVVAGGGWLNEDEGLLCVCDADSGAVLLEDKSLPQRVNVVAFSHDGALLAAAADKVHLYLRHGKGYRSLNRTDSSLDLDGDVKALAVHPSGEWLVAGDQSGNAALVTLRHGTIDTIHYWKAPHKPGNRTKPNSPSRPIPFLRAVIAEQNDVFAIGGGDFVYSFTRDSFLRGIPVAEYDTWDGDAPNGQKSGSGKVREQTYPAENVRSVALSADGGMLAVVANRRIAGAATGALLVYKNGNQSPAWHLRLPRNPNDVSLNRDGSRIAIADGFPPGEPAAFLVFDGDGHELWQYPTTDMNWPIAINREGTVLAAGSDDGKLYYFEL